MAEVVAFISRFAARLERAGPHRTPRSRRSRADGRRLPTSPPISGEHPLPVRGARQRRLQRAERAGARTPAVPAVDRAGHAVRLPQPGPAARRRRARRRRVGHRRAARRRDPRSPAVRSRSRSASTCGCRAPIAAATCCGGWTPPGVWNQRYDEIDDLTRARRLPSPQLVGTPERAHARPQRARARWASQLVGRLVGDPRRPGAVLGRPAQPVRARRPQDGAAARHVRRVGAHRPDATPTSAPPERFEPTRVPRVVAARSSISRSGEIRIDRLGDRASTRTTAGSTCRCSTRRASCGTTAAWSTRPGMYALGLPVLRRRKSTFIHGIEDDARDVIDHLGGYLAGAGRLPSVQEER